MGKDYDGLEVHRVKQGDPADRSSYTPLDGEIIQTFGGFSSKVYIGANANAGGFLIGPSGVFYGIETAATDLVIATVIPWGTTTNKTEEFTHSTSTNPSEITIAEDGVYSITMAITAHWTATALMEAHIQRYNGSVWASRNGAKIFQNGIAGEKHTVVVQLVDGFLAGWKFRGIASNYNFIAGQVACHANYSSIKATRIR